jgi:hypothetical protein
MSIVLIRHGEKSPHNSNQLSNKGKVRAEELVLFVGKKWNIPKPDILVASPGLSFETLRPLGDKLKKSIVISTDIPFLKKSIASGKILLFCGSVSEIVKVSEALTNTLHLSWGFNPEADSHSYSLYSPVWKINKKELLVANQFDVKRNLKVDYSKVSKKPMFKYLLANHQNKNSFLGTCYAYTLKPFVSLVF